MTDMKIELKKYESLKGYVEKHTKRQGGLFKKTRVKGLRNFCHPVTKKGLIKACEHKLLLTTFEKSLFEKLEMRLKKIIKDDDDKELKEMLEMVQLVLSAPVEIDPIPLREIREKRKEEKYKYERELIYKLFKEGEAFSFFERYRYRYRKLTWYNDNFIEEAWLEYGKLVVKSDGTKEWVRTNKEEATHYGLQVLEVVAPESSLMEHEWEANRFMEEDGLIYPLKFVVNPIP